MRYILITIISMLFIGCTKEQPQPPRIIYKTIYKTKKVYIPTTCDAPKPTCSFKGKNFEPTVKLLKCVVIQKQYIDTCFKKDKK